MNLTKRNRQTDINIWHTVCNCFLWKAQNHHKGKIDKGAIINIGPYNTVYSLTDQIGLDFMVTTHQPSIHTVYQKNWGKFRATRVQCNVALNMINTGFLQPTFGYFHFWDKTPPLEVEKFSETTQFLSPFLTLPLCV